MMRSWAGTVLKLRGLPICMVMCFLVCACAAEAWEKRWEYQNGELPLNNGGTRMRVASELKTPDGGNVLEVTQAFSTEELLYPSHIQFPLQRSLLADGETVEIQFWARSSSGTQIELRCTELLPYSGHYSDTERFTLDGSWRKISVKAQLRNLGWEPYAAVPRILLTRHPAGVKFYFGPVVIRNVEKK